MIVQKKQAPGAAPWDDPSGATPAVASTDLSDAPNTASAAKAKPAIAAPTTSSVSTSSTAATPQPAMSALNINQLPDGVGGTIPVPPPAVAGGISPFSGGMLATTKSMSAPTTANVDPAVANPGNFGAATPPGAPPPTSQSTFSADSNLINSQINPSADPRLLKTQGMSDDLLSKITQGPDRLALAQQYYDTFNKATEPDYQHSLTDATDAAAAHGQIRSGQLTNRYGDLARQRLNDQEVAKQNLLNAATSGSIADRQQAYQDATAAEGQQFAQGQGNRAEQRGERGYQEGLSEQALLNRIAQQQAENSQSNEAIDQAQQNYGIGTANDPGGAYGDVSNSAQARASSANAQVAALLQALARRNSSRDTTTAGVA